MATGARHLLFVWKASGYELRERDGDAPTPGTQLEEDEGRYVVSKLGPSPLPGDDRVCAYLQAV